MERLKDGGAAVGGGAFGGTTEGRRGSVWRAAFGGGRLKDGGAAFGGTTEGRRGSVWEDD